MKDKEKEIEEQMRQSIEKIPFEMKKIKFFLFILKKVNNFKRWFFWFRKN